MSENTLYTRFRHLKGLMCLVVGEYAGVKVNELNLTFSEQKTPEFLVINPLGQIPTLVSDTVPIAQTTAIMRYISRLGNSKTLLGETLYENALVDQWFDFVNIEFFKPFLAFYLPLLGYHSYDQNLNGIAKARIEYLTHIIEDTLKTRPYLVGKNISVADICLAVFFSPLLRYCLGEDFRKKFPNTIKWFVGLFNEPNFRKHLGPAHLCQQPMCHTMFRPIVIIWGKGFNFRVLAAQALCELSGLKYETRVVNSYDDLKNSEFLQLNPLGQIPTIKVGNESFWQTSAVYRHLARLGNPSLLGNNNYENSLVDQWCDFYNCEYNKFSVKLIYPLYGHHAYTESGYNSDKQAFLRLSRIIDNQLKGKEYFIGSHITIVDFFFLPSFIQLFRFSLGDDFKKAHPNITKWIKNITNLDVIKNHFGNPHFCQQTQVPPKNFVSK